MLNMLTFDKGVSAASVSSTAKTVALSLDSDKTLPTSDTYNMLYEKYEDKMRFSSYSDKIMTFHFVDKSVLFWSSLWQSWCYTATSFQEIIGGESYTRGLPSEENSEGEQIAIAKFM